MEFTENSSHLCNPILWIYYILLFIWNSSMKIISCLVLLRMHCANAASIYSLMFFENWVFRCLNFNHLYDIPNFFFRAVSIFESQGTLLLLSLAHTLFLMSLIGWSYLNLIVNILLFYQASLHLSLHFLIFLYDIIIDQETPVFPLGIAVLRRRNPGEKLGIRSHSKATFNSSQ